jgi:large subunit ribosomal protein L10
VNRDEKAAVIVEVRGPDPRSPGCARGRPDGADVKQSADLRGRLEEGDASFRVVKNRLTVRSADEAGAEALKAFLEGPTAFTFVRGDAATAAKTLATFRRESGRLVFKGGTLDGAALTADQVEEISRLPSREQLQAQFVGVVASPLTGLVRGLGALVGGLAVALGEVRDRGLVGGGDAPTGPSPSDAGSPQASSPETPEAEAPPAEAPGDPVAEAVAAEEETSNDAPPEGEQSE